MKYMGAKTRIAKEIVPIIQQVISSNNITNYIEPFCGGCNIIDKIFCTNRTAADINPYLIGLFKHLQSGGDLLPAVSRELYSDVREKYKQENAYPEWVIGNVGFLASFNGRFFDGGYAKPGYEKTKTGQRYRDYYREASDNIKSQIPRLYNVLFDCVDYREHTPSGAVIYCDPPYANEKQYANSKTFNYDEFWEVMREWSENNFVLISEMNAPEDFVCVWEKSVLRSIKAADKSRDTEKLFVFGGGLLGKEGAI